MSGRRRGRPHAGAKPSRRLGSCRRPPREPSSSSTTDRRARRGSSSSTGTTSPTGRSSRCPRSWRRREGFPTNALLGFVNMLFKLLVDYQPKGVAVAWDTRPDASARGRRRSTRPSARPMPDLLREQFPHFRPIVEAFGYRNLEFEGWEADDVIATIATRADEAGVTHVRRVDRPRRVPALLGERVPDDDAARRRGRAGLHARRASRPATASRPRRCRTSSASRATPPTTSRAFPASATRRPAS